MVLFEVVMAYSWPRPFTSMWARTTEHSADAGHVSWHVSCLWAGLGDTMWRKSTCTASPVDEHGAVG